MIHHVSLGSNDLRRSREFYDPVLTVLQLRLVSGAIAARILLAIHATTLRYGAAASSAPAAASSS
jgi:hypothetical protein